MKILIYVLASPTDSDSPSTDSDSSLNASDTMKRKLMNMDSEVSLNPSPPPSLNSQGRILFNPLTFDEDVRSVEGAVIPFNRALLQDFDSSELIQLRVNITYPTLEGVVYGGISYTNISVGVRESLSIDNYVYGRSPYVSFSSNLYEYEDPRVLSAIRGKGTALTGIQADLNQVLSSIQITPPVAFTGLFNIEIGIIYPLLSNDFPKDLTMSLYILPAVEAPVVAVDYIESDQGGLMSQNSYCNMSASSLFQVSIFHSDVNCYKGLYSISFSSNTAAPLYHLIHDSSITSVPDSTSNMPTSTPEFLILASTDGLYSGGISGLVGPLEVRLCYPAEMRGSGGMGTLGCVVSYLGCPDIDNNGEFNVTSTGIVNTSENVTTVFTIEQGAPPAISYNTTHVLCEEDLPCELPIFSITTPPLTGLGPSVVVVASLSLLHGKFQFSSESSNITGMYSYMYIHFI